MAARLAEEERADPRPELLTTRVAPARRVVGEVREVGSSRAELMADPALSAVIDFG
jgi:hypothetical protein